MKIIDLLNKIANDEEVPEKIRFEGKIFEKQDETSFYCTGFGIFEQAFVLEDLNKEVEIIDEETKENKPFKEDKKIEKLDVIPYEKCIHEVTHKEKEILLEIRDVQMKFNEIIDILNKGDNND